MKLSPIRIPWRASAYNTSAIDGIPAFNSGAGFKRKLEEVSRTTAASKDALRSPEFTGRQGAGLGSHEERFSVRCNDMCSDAQPSDDLPNAIKRHE